MMPPMLAGPDTGAYAMGELYGRAFYQSSATASLAPAVWGCLFRMLQASTGSRTLMSNRSTSPLGGFELTLTAAEQVQARIVDGSGTNRARLFTTTTLTAGDTIHAAIGQYSGGVLSCGVDRGTLLTLGSLTGFTAATSVPFRCGQDATGTSGECTDLDFLGYVLGDTAQTQAEWEAWCDACKAAGDVVALPAGTTTFLARVKCRLSNLSAPIVWGTEANTLGFTFPLASRNATNGHRPTVTRISAPTWGW